MNYRFDLTLDNARSQAITIKLLLDRDPVNFLEVGHALGRFKLRIEQAHDQVSSAHEASWIRIIDKKVQRIHDVLIGAAGDVPGYSTADAVQICFDIIEVVKQAQAWWKEAYGKRKWIEGSEWGNVVKS